MSLKASYLGSSLPLGRYFDIPVRVHWSFVLLLGFIFYVSQRHSMTPAQTIWFFGFVGLLFLFVIMHEYGHALMARRYGVATRDIIISPIGGIARLENLPKDPWQELLIAIAGPAVNLILAVLIFLIQWFVFPEILPEVDSGFHFDSWPHFMAYLLVLNVVLVLFNMVPAFPMDGGRVLRAGLQMKLKDRRKATMWAVRIGQVIAVSFMMLAIYNQHMTLGFIGAFVFLTARQELITVTQQHRLNSYTAIDIARSLPRYNLSVSVDQIDEEHHATDILVVDDTGKVMGVLPVLLTRHRPEIFHSPLPISQLMTQHFGEVQSDILLIQLFEVLHQNNWVVALVRDEAGEMVGAITRQQLERFIA